MGSILEIKSTGLGSAVRAIKRHSKVRVPKVSHGVRKIKRAYAKTERSKAKKIVKTEISRRKVRAKVKKELVKYDKYGDRVYKKK